MSVEGTILSATTVSEDPFDSADWYSIRDTELLTHETVEEALEEHFEWSYDAKRTVVQRMDDECPIEVIAHKRIPITETWLANRARELLDHIGEEFGQEHGDPDGNYASDIETPENSAAALELVRKVVGGLNVWSCEQVATRELSYEQVEAILRESAPHWFKSATTAAAPGPLPDGAVAPDGFTVASGFMGNPEAWCWWDDEYPEDGATGPFKTAAEACADCAAEAGEIADG